MPHRRASIDIFGQWLLFVLLPALVRFLILWPFWLWRWCRPRQAELPGEVDDFYRSARWRKLRVRRLEINIATYGRLTCELCMTTNPGGAWHIHHIKSRSRHPELALAIENTAVLCEADNLAMSNDYEDLSLKRCERKYANHRRA